MKDKLKIFVNQMARLGIERRISVMTVLDRTEVQSYRYLGKETDICEHQEHQLALAAAKEITGKYATRYDDVHGNLHHEMSLVVMHRQDFERLVNGLDDIAKEIEKL